MKKWNVTVKGKSHEIGFKQGILKTYKVVDGEATPIRSTHWCVRVIDELIELEGDQLHLTVIGWKKDLAVDGVYLKSKKPYVPLSVIPKWMNVALLALIIFSWQLCGLFGGLVGIGGGMLMVLKSISPNRKALIPTCIIITLLCIVIDILSVFFIYSMLGA